MMARIFEEVAISSLGEVGSSIIIISSVEKRMQTSSSSFESSSGLRMEEIKSKYLQ